MAKVIPFSAVCPSKDKASLVVSKSYQNYSNKERLATLAYNPFSFLHILNPGFRFQRRVRGEMRFRMVRNRYWEFKEDQILKQDNNPGFYLYEINSKKHSYLGLIAGTSVAEYEEKKIKRHENTIHKREEIFKDYLKAVGFNAEPVLLMHADNQALDSLYQQIRKGEPDYYFATIDGMTHILWKVIDLDYIQKIQLLFEAIPELYIADGHHRTSSSYLLAQDKAQENPNHTGEESYNFFMSYLLSESQVRIFEFNRLVRDLNGLSKQEFLIKLDEVFRIDNRGTQLYRPSVKHHFAMYLDGEFYSLYLRKSYHFSDALSELDTHILFKTVLEPILNIHDMRNDDRIHYIYGKDNVLQMKELIDNKLFSVGFGMVPITVSEIKKVADEELVMPPKSTYIEPKLPSGLTIYEF